MSAKLKTLTLALSLTLPLASIALERTDLLPAEAQSYIRVSNTTNFWSKLKQSSIGKLWIDSQFQDFLGNPDAETWQEFFFESESDAEDKVFMEQLKMLTGEVVLAFDMERKDPYIIATMSKTDFLRSLEMDLQLQNLTEEPFEIIRDAFQDVEIIQHIEDGGTPDEESSWQACLNNTFILGYTREWIEKSIIQLKKEPLEEPDGTPELNINIPLSKLIMTVAKEEDEGLADHPEETSTELLFDALGLLGIKNFSADITLQENEMVIDNNLMVEDLTKGLFTLLDLRPSELPSVGFIPENMTSLEVGRFNLLRFWQEIPTVLATAMPAVKPQFDMITMMIQQQSSINLEQDLLANIGNKYISYTVIETDEPISVIAVELKDSIAFKTGLETAFAAPAIQPQIAMALDTETFLDQTIYTVKESEPGNIIAFSVVGDYLLYGPTKGLHQVIRSENNDTETIGIFERSPLVKGLRQHIPSRAFGFSAIDWKKYMTVIVQEINQPDRIAMIQKKWAASGSPLPPPDFTKLPSADHMASFFNMTYQYTEAVGKGLHQKIILKY